MTVQVELDEAVAADVLAFLTACAGWGDEWQPLLGRADEAIAPLREALRIDVALESRDRITDAARKMADHSHASDLATALEYAIVETDYCYCCHNHPSRGHAEGCSLVRFRGSR